MKHLMATVEESPERQIAHAIHAVARAIDQDRLEEVPGYFIELGTYKVATRLNVDRGLPLAQINCANRNMIADRILALRKANIFPRQTYRHLITGIAVEAAGDTYSATSNYLVIRTLADGSSTIYSSGEYRDRFVFIDAEPRIAERFVVQDSHLIDTVLAIPI